MRSLSVALLSIDELPATLGQESMVRACDKFGTVRQAHPVGGLARAPVREDRGLDVVPVVAAFLGAVDLVSGSNLRERLDAAVSHEDRRFPIEAVDTAMLASAIRVDRLVERDVGRVVARDDRLRGFARDLGADRRQRFLVAPPTVVDRLALERLVAALEVGWRAASLGRAA